MTGTSGAGVPVTPAPIDEDGDEDEEDEEDDDGDDDDEGEDDGLVLALALVLAGFIFAVETTLALEVIPPPNPNPSIIKSPILLSAAPALSPGVVTVTDAPGFSAVPASSEERGDGFKAGDMKERVLVPIIIRAEGLREMGVPETVTAGALGRIVVSSLMGKPVGFKV